MTGVHYTKNEDAGGQDPSVFIKSEELNEGTGEIDYSKKYILPSIKTRFFSTLIDVLVIVLVSIGILYLLEAIGQVPGLFRVALFAVVILLYEPFLIAYGVTVGQFILDIRVRKFNNPENKLAFHLSVLRTLVKVLLGWLSFVTVTFNINRRAIHDMVSGSIMISNRIA